MSRRTTKAAPQPLSPDVLETAEAQAEADRALMERLANENKKDQKPTLADNYFSAVGLVQQAKRETRLSETTLVRMWELTLMWALNNRQQPQPQFMMPDMDPQDVPEVHEIITGEAE